MSNHLDYEINKELGECYLFMGDLEKALEYYDKAINSNGRHPEPYLGLATIAVQQGDLDKAMVLYKKAADIEPDDKALAGMALIEMESGAHEEAFAHFNQAVDKNPENMIAICCMVQLGHAMDRLGDVIPRLADYLAIDPLKTEVRYSLAGCLAATGENEEAASHLERILENDPEHGPALDLLEQIRS
ncbi:MAG: tetratricopeptide repeat protein [Thermodesulfobacteriota bacterium]|nr:tetratricopeptide repeat protein [Thermodesulfobacteriota bacterium]